MAGGVALATLHLPAEVFLTSLILGGGLERHPGLRVVVLEMGAQWVSSWVERLDAVAIGYRAFGLRPLELLPSEVIRRQVRVTPFERNQLGAWLDRDGLREVYAFASDFPHAEGGRNPVARLSQVAGRPWRRAARTVLRHQRFADPRRHRGCRGQRPMRVGLVAVPTVDVMRPRLPVRLASNRPNDATAPVLRPSGRMPSGRVLPMRSTCWPACCSVGGTMSSSPIWWPTEAAASHRTGSTTSTSSG